MFQIPVKEIIVNSDSQVVAKNATGGAYLSPNMATANANAGLFLEGFLTEVIWASKTIADNTTYTLSNRAGNTSYFAASTAGGKIIKTAASAGTQGTASYVLTVANCAAGTVFRLVEDTLDLTPVQYQNRPIEKRYQVSAAQTTIDGVGAAIAAAINADPNAWATVTYTAGTDTLLLTSKKVGTRIQLFSVDYALPTPTLVQGTLPIGTYDAVKNINWAKNFNIDQNINWMPLPGASYNVYYFEVNSRSIAASYGNSPIPNEAHNSQIYGVRLYVKSGLTLDNALTAADGDLVTLG
jgi:hypothetical protein